MKCLLYTRSGPDVFSYQGPHDTYLSALNLGQTFGWGIFYIDCASRVPSRNTQLGFTPNDFVKYKITRQRSKKNKLIQED